jgi:hypothetical protein
MNDRRLSRTTQGYDLQADARLNHRCLGVANVLSEHPLAPINQACEDWADTEAAYRFMDNAHVSPSAILAPHCQRTVERLKAHPLILAGLDNSVR